MPTTKPAVIPYTDLLYLPEVYSDHIRLAHFDGQTVRIEFAVVRAAVAERNQVGPTVYPAARLVLSAPAAVALHSKLGMLISALANAGFVKESGSQTPTEQ